MIKINQNPLPLAFAASLQQDTYPAIPLLEFLVEMESGVSQGATHCEYPHCQFEQPLMRRHLKSDDILFFLRLVLINWVVPRDFKADEKNPEQLIRSQMQSLRDGATEHSVKLLTRASLGSIVGDDQTDRNQKTVIRATQHLHRAIDAVLLLTPLDINDALAGEINKICGARNDEIVRLFNVIFLDQYAVTHFSDKERLCRHIKTVMDYGLHLASLLDEKHVHPVDCYQHTDNLSTKRRESYYSSTAYPVHLINMIDWLIYLKAKHPAHVNVDEVTLANFSYHGKQHLYDDEREVLNNKLAQYHQL